MNTQKTFNKLFARLQLQAKLREIADAHSEPIMLEVLAEALRIEFQYQDLKTQKSQAKLNT
jgi:hypothetical protein